MPIEVDYAAERIYTVKAGRRREVPLPPPVQADIIDAVIDDLQQAMVNVVKRRFDDVPAGLLNEE